jgi:hypothetical protein
MTWLRLKWLERRPILPFLDRRALLWDGQIPGYGLAYNYTVASIRRAYYNLQASYFK